MAGMGSTARQQGPLHRPSCQFPLERHHPYWFPYLTQLSSLASAPGMGHMGNSSGGKDDSSDGSGKEVGRAGSGGMAGMGSTARQRDPLRQPSCQSP
eukprot:TRINITY_DN11306_c0_g1_i3.p2 TRINITY_DN11306_c0_g1~~TRINITY_DN11306_c0_g1_i3.p2  ORF type:complete len:113 (-),score=16.25 TRINITY_DN11306_c0_g1_i3:529-819(-)